MRVILSASGRSGSNDHPGELHRPTGTRALRDMFLKGSGNMVDVVPREWVVEKKGIQGWSFLRIIVIVLMRMIVLPWVIIPLDYLCKVGLTRGTRQAMFRPRPLIRAFMTEGRVPFRYRRPISHRRDRKTPSRIGSLDSLWSCRRLYRNYWQSTRLSLLRSRTV